jgi:serine protease AprX
VSVLFLMVIMMVVPATSAAGASRGTAPAAEDLPWWDDTDMDRNGNRLHDALERTLELGAFIEDGRIEVLVDFDHTPTGKDESMLVERTDFEPRFRFHWIDIISGSVEVDRIPELLELPGVVFVSFNSRVEAFMDEVVLEHNVPEVWDLGYTGEGMTVAVIDTGIDADHVGLNDFDDNPLTNDPKVVAFYDAIASPDQTDGSTQPYDDHGHGSHCAGIAAGTGEEDPLEADGQDNNRYVGVAPGANLIGVKVLDGGGSGSFDQVMAGMEWCIDHRVEFNIRAATMSLGGAWLLELTQSEEEQLSTLANTMVKEGIALTIAAGNSGTYGSIGTPGNGRDVITVGATEKNRNSAAYSSRGPTEEGLIKPNLAAIGSNVVSVQANSGNGYTGMSGTSMATPVVAGIMCLMLEANPDLDPLTLRSLLEYTSEYRWLTHPMRPNNDYGWGFVEADAALAEAVTIDPSLNITLDPETPERVYVGNETEGNSTRYLGYMNEEIMFYVEGNPSGIEWRPVNGSSWIQVNRLEPAVVGIPLHDHSILPGNHSIWVRAYGDDGVSPPLHLLLEIDEARGTGEDDEGINAMYYGFPVILVLVLVAAWLFTRRNDHIELNGPEGTEDPDDDTPVF